MILFFNRLLILLMVDTEYSMISAHSSNECSLFLNHISVSSSLVRLAFSIIYINSGFVKFGIFIYTSNSLFTKLFRFSFYLFLFNIAIPLALPSLRFRSLSFCPIIHISLRSSVYVVISIPIL